jgi:hypothetical protein
MSHHIQLNTPSGGKNEVLRAMVRCNARVGTQPLARITRCLGPHYSTAAVNTVLTALVSDGYVTNPSGTDWKLTGAGFTYIRSRPNSRFVAA